MPRPAQTIRIQNALASRGGSRGYSVEFRQHALQQAANGIRIASARSLQRWNHRLIPLKINGNKATLNLSGEYQMLLIIYRLIFPYANADEVRAYICNNAIVPVLFSRSAIWYLSFLF